MEARTYMYANCWRGGYTSLQNIEFS